jgi:archaellum component FlaD/FlaE
VSELDFLLNRKKSIEKKEEKSTAENVEKSEERIEKAQEEKKEENSTVESKKEEETLKVEGKKDEEREKTVENTPESTKNNIEDKGKKEDSEEDSIESIMKKFLEKDPKIGIWSYPAYLVLQYLYNTKPGFKMSRVAKEALEYGLKHMYPDLFSKAEKISQLKQR